MILKCKGSVILSILVILNTIENIAGTTIIPGNYYNGLSPVTYTSSHNDDDLGILLAILLLASRNRDCGYYGGYGNGANFGYGNGGNIGYGNGGNCGYANGGNCGYCCNGCGNAPAAIPVPYPIPIPTTIITGNGRDDAEDKNENESDSASSSSSAGGSAQSDPTQVVNIIEEPSLEAQSSSSSAAAAAAAS